MQLETVIDALASQMPSIMRYAGGIARQLRQFDISLDNKASLNPHTDALTLADLTVQELLVSALRDSDPLFRQCRLDVEEAAGDLHLFASEAEYTISLDPIDGTKRYRDGTGSGYAVILCLRSPATVHYSLVHLPEAGEHGGWVEVRDLRVVRGSDNPTRTAVEVLRSLPAVEASSRPDSNKIYFHGFQRQDASKAELLTQSGFEVISMDDIERLGNIYDLYARGEVGGVLVHSPNVYDFPVLLHIARVFGGDARRVNSCRPVDFCELWQDERADMLRLPGIVACSTNPATLNGLCGLARDWSELRYAG